MRVHGLFSLAVGLTGLVFVSTSAYSQVAAPSLAGVVKDPSGAVLPGVTVEASSDVLIEKTRTAVTNGSGQYRIENLLPGVYTMTFALSGFASVKREGVEVSGVGVITINADMRVGAVAETVIVTGETPVVDVQSARRGQTLAGDVIKDLPAARGYNALLQAVPSVTEIPSRLRSTRRCAPLRATAAEATKATSRWTASTSGRRSTAGRVRAHHGHE
jgi:hypothetical protein